MARDAHSSDGEGHHKKNHVRLTALLAASCVLATAYAGPAPDLILRGTIAAGEHQSYRLVPFDVPAGVSAIEVDFDYSGREARTTIDVGLLGPGENFEQAFRGWSGGNKRSFIVGTSDATPSYLAAPLAAGRWNLLLGVPNIRSGQTSGFTAQIHFRRQPPAPLRSEPGWYRGDLHTHTGHSDGNCASQSGTQRVPCPLFLTLQTAADRGLDFVAVTEHNTNSHVRELTALQPYFDRLLLIPGMELTTFQGHANAFGVSEPIDFRVGTAQVPDWNALLATLAARSILVSVNHPRLPSGEVCMGCGWSPQPAADLSRLAAVEAVNGYFAEGPYAGVSFWHELLQLGHRPTAIGGSDTHDIGAKDALPPPGRIGIPATVVYAKELSVAAILDGIRSGRVFIDVQGTRDRSLEWNAHVGDAAPASQTIFMGGELMLARGESARFEVRVRNVPQGRIEIVRDGVLLESVPGLTIVGDDHRASFTEQGDGARHWLRVDVRDRDGQLALVGNPIHVNRAASR